MKRNRSKSPAHPLAGDDVGASRHTSKFQRIETPTFDSSEPLWCSLAPGCAPPNVPSSFQTLDELEQHYTQYHAYVCNSEGCSCVFEREFYLSLHQAELHDPLAQIRKERGESIYRCLVPECPQMMQSPTQRKRHLIKDHHFDENFFFAVIRFGIGDQLRAWGSGKERVQTVSRANNARRDQESPKYNEGYTIEGGDLGVQSDQMGRRRTPKSSAQSSRASSSQPFDSGIEDLTQNMQRTSLFPDSVQFGRDATRAAPPKHAPYKRNASFPDIKMNSLHYSRSGKMSDEGDGDDEGRDGSLEGDEPQVGVRFAEEVAIRFLSPVDRRYKHGRKRNSGRGNGRTGGVHSDDEGGGRSRSFRDNRSHNAGRGRSRGNRGRATNRSGEGYPN